jgi:hypothetical protein
MLLSTPARIVTTSTTLLAGVSATIRGRSRNSSIPLPPILNYDVAGLNARRFGASGLIDIRDDHTPRRLRVQVGNHVRSSLPEPETEAVIARVFDHLVDAVEEGRRNVEAERLRGLKVDRQRTWSAAERGDRQALRL